MPQQLEQLYFPKECKLTKRAEKLRKKKARKKRRLSSPEIVALEKELHPQNIAKKPYTEGGEKREEMASVTKEEGGVV